MRAACSNAVFRQSRRTSDPAGLVRAGRAARALEPAERTPTGCFARPSAPAADPAIVQTEWGELFLEKHNGRRSAEVVPGRACRRSRAGRRRTPASHACSKTTTPRRRRRRPTRRSQSTRAGRRASGPGEHAPRRRPRQRSQGRNGQGARRQPRAARGARAARRHGLRQGRQADVRIAKSPLRSRPIRLYGEVLSHRRRAGRQQLPLRGGGGARAEGARRSIRRTRRAASDLGMHLLRTGDEPGARAARSKRSFKRRSVRRRRPSTCSTMLDKLDKFDTVTRRRPHLARWTRTRRRCCRSTRSRSRTGASRRLSARYEIHAEGADPDRDLSEARRLRRPQRRPARHDRRARRLLRPRRDDGFAEGAATGRRSSGRRRSGTSWPTSSRSRCRTSACRAGSPKASPSTRKGAQRPEWGRDMDMTFARAMDNGKVLKLRDLNAGFTRSETIALAYYEASLLVDHIVATYGAGRGSTAGPRVRRGPRHRRGAQGGARHRFRRAAGIGFDQYARATSSARCRRALHDADKRCRRTARSTSCKAHAGANPESYIGAAGARRGAARRAATPTSVRGVRARLASSCRTRSARTARTRSMADAAPASSRIKPRAIAELPGAARRGLRQRRGGAHARDDRAEAADDDAAKPRRHERIVALDPFDGDAHAALGRLAMQRERRRVGDARIPRRARAQTGRPGGGAHRSRRKLLQGRQAGRREEADARGARDRADLRARPGTAAQAGARREP